MAQKFCIYCGAELKSDLKFCPKCGKPLRQVDNNDVLSEEQKQSGDGSLNALLKKVFRIWDVVGASVTFPLWFTAFFLLLVEPVYTSESISFFASFRYNQSAGFSFPAFSMLIVQCISIIVYIALVAGRKGKIGRIVTAGISFGLALALLLIGFIHLEFGAGFLILGILESVIIGLYTIGLLVSILKKPEAGVKSEDDE